MSLSVLIDVEARLDIESGVDVIIVATFHFEILCDLEWIFLRIAHEVLPNWRFISKFQSNSSIEATNPIVTNHVNVLGKLLLSGKLFVSSSSTTTVLGIIDELSSDSE